MLFKNIMNTANYVVLKIATSYINSRILDQKVLLHARHCQLLADILHLIFLTNIELKFMLVFPSQNTFIEGRNIFFRKQISSQPS